MRNPLERRCRFSDVCTKQINSEHYHSHCRGIIVTNSVFCDEYDKLKREQDIQNERTANEWNNNPVVKQVQIPQSQSPKVSKYSKKKRARDWFNPSRRQNLGKE